MEYWEMVIEKVNEFNFLNEVVEKFTTKLNQNLANVRGLSYLRHKDISYLLFHSDMVICC